MKLTEFLLARIAEDEAAARRHGAHVSGRCPASLGGKCRNMPGCRSRVLAECESKRRIVERHNHRGYVCEDGLNLPRESEWLDILHLLALPYRVHLDYDPAWAL